LTADLVSAALHTRRGDRWEEEGHPRRFRMASNPANPGHSAPDCRKCRWRATESVWTDL